MRKITAFILIIFASLYVYTNNYSSNGVYAQGGRNAECEDAQVGGYDAGTGSAKVYTNTSGQVVSGVCIKAGTNMFEGDGHSGILGNGTYETACYTILGVGTGSLTVTKNFSSDSCQDISHLDIYLTDGSNQNPTATPTATQSEPTFTPTPTQDPGSNCFEYGCECDFLCGCENNNELCNITPTGGQNIGNIVLTPTRTPSVTVTQTPTPTVTPEPTATSTPNNPTATPAPGIGGGSSNGESSSSSSSTGGGEVLGASTLPAMGTFTDSLMDALLIVGLLFLVLARKVYAPAKAQ